MRILQVVALLSPDGAYGGPARVALNQSAELVERGHHVILAAAARGYATPPTAVDGVPVRLFGTRTVVPGAGFPGLSSPGLARWVHGNATGFDVVHVHFGRDLMVLPAAVAARRQGLPYLLQTHGMVIPSDHKLAGPLDGLFTRPLLRGADAVLYLTDLERAQLETVARSPIMLKHLSNGVPEGPPRTEVPGRTEVLFVARIHPRKRPLAFIEMAKALLADGVDAEFTLIGPDEGEGAAVRTALAGETNISWEGALPPDEIPNRMAKAHLFVLPSVSEPYPMSVLEAMSVGLPVVIADDCGLAPVVRQAGCGVVVDGAVPDFVDAVKFILGEPGRTSELGRRARALVRDDFGMGAIGDRLEELYDDARSAA